ncbi:MAG: beta-lactamase family protein, partial [Armatimonadetes bacterium]|nr:beta-lactamase family protein [Armatimonadota bacterium]
GAKAWLNGKLVLDVYPPSGRAYTARQDRVHVRLARGANRLLVKVENTIGGWELGVEVVGARAARAIAREEARLAQVREALYLDIEPGQGRWVFAPGELPRVTWRDPIRARELLGDVKLTVRWFNSQLAEVQRADGPGRYMAVVSGKLRDGTPLWRGLTAYCRPPGTFQWWLDEWNLATPFIGAPISPEVWRERSQYVSIASSDLLRTALLTTGQGAAFLAGMAEAKPAGRPMTFVESPDVVNCDVHAALKRRALGITGSPREPAPPRARSGSPAPVIREGTPAEAGVAPEAKQRIDAVCATWARESGEPFSVLVARHGVIIAHDGFGELAPGKACTTDFRFEVASITKAISGMLFSRFVDQGLLAVDEPLGKVLPGFPTSGPRAITYRHCFTHTAGFDGHGEFGGIWNPYLDSVLAQWLRDLKPGTGHLYNGMGYDLAGKAMELITGKSVARLFTEHLFAPLGFQDVPINDMAFGARLTARELAVLGQLLANKGSYGPKEFISEATYDKLLPRKLSEFWPAIGVEWGIGLTHMPDRRDGAGADSAALSDFNLGLRTIGHGSATSCILRVDPDQDLVIAMIRRTAGKDYDKHARALFAAVHEAITR